MTRSRLASFALVAALASGCSAEAPTTLRFGVGIPCDSLTEAQATGCTDVDEGSTTTSDGGSSGTTEPWSITTFDDSTDGGSTGGSWGTSGSTYGGSTGGSWGTSGSTTEATTGGSWNTTEATSGGSWSTTEATTGGSWNTTEEPTGGSWNTTEAPTGGSWNTTEATSGGSWNTTEEPTGGSWNTTEEPTGGSWTGDTTMGSWTGDTTEGESGDDVTGAPANACSDQCPFAQGGGLPAMVGPGSKLPYVEGCAERKPPPRAPTSAIVECLTNLACHLGRNPTKIEALTALGIDRPTSMLGPNVIYSASSESGQPITNALSDKPEGIRSLRNISAPFTEGAPWCSFTTLSDDFTLECMNIGFLGAPDFETCGTEPVGIKLDELCEALDETTTTPASAAVFKTLAATGVDGGADSCDVCHEQLTGRSAKNGKDCYFFPIAGPVALCPTKALLAKCAKETDKPSCADASIPRCPSRTTKTGSTATCNNGADATCPGPANATCQIHVGVFGEIQELPTNFVEQSSLCVTMKQIQKNAAAQLQQGPSLPWTNTTFIDAYVDAFCKTTP
ncbi:MAG: hypothetical protein R3B09_09250 [Nannocystaceae bacterium]